MYASAPDDIEDDVGLGGEDLAGSADSRACKGTVVTRAVGKAHVEGIRAASHAG